MISTQKKNLIYKVIFCVFWVILNILNKLFLHENLTKNLEIFTPPGEKFLSFFKNFMKKMFV